MTLHHSDATGATRPARPHNGEMPQDIARMLTALAEPTRLRILALLGSGDLCVCEIQRALRVAQPTVSRHLAYLRRAGLVTTRREGLWIHYERAADVPDGLRSVVETLEESIATSPQGVKDRRRLAAQPRCCMPDHPRSSEA